MFNWLDSPKPTARYAEALACGVIPLVWKQYDNDATLPIDLWQRCYSLDEVLAKIRNFAESEKMRKETLARLEEAYEKKLPSKDDQYFILEKLLKKAGIE